MKCLLIYLSQNFWNKYSPFSRIWYLVLFRVITEYRRISKTEIIFSLGKFVLLQVKRHFRLLGQSRLLSSPQEHARCKEPPQHIGNRCGRNRRWGVFDQFDEDEVRSSRRAHNIGRVRGGIATGIVGKGNPLHDHSRTLVVAVEDDIPGVLNIVL